MCTATETNTSSLEELDFEITCEMIWYYVLTGQEHSRCDKTAEYIVKYKSYCKDDIRTIPMCQSCVNELREGSLIEIQPLKGS
jgi:hypothetical protein